MWRLRQLPRNSQEEVNDKTSDVVEARKSFVLHLGLGAVNGLERMMARGWGKAVHE